MVIFFPFRFKSRFRFRFRFRFRWNCFRDNDPGVGITCTTRTMGTMDVLRSPRPQCRSEVGVDLHIDVGFGVDVGSKPVQLELFQRALQLRRGGRTCRCGGGGIEG